jgi:uncharacterized protein YprB with RNaseH-like and TPR domain
MDRAALAARIQDILKNRSKPAAHAPAEEASTSGPDVRQTVTVPDEESAFAARCSAAEAASRVLDVLGATLADGARGPSVVVERSYPASHRHGHHEVERYQAAVASARESLPWFLRPSGRSPGDEVPPAEPRLLFFDLETTGLSGGAGTYAFLVGFGFFDDDGFRTRQYFLRGYGEERALLDAVAREISERHAAGGLVLVTYNGRSFDVPLIDTRYQFNRMRSPFDGMPHVDMLFPARRLWKRRPTPAVGSRQVAGGGVMREPAASRKPEAGSRPDDAPGSCSLTALERDILGLYRQDDVPGWEIPGRYFGYARTGDAGGLAAVFEHNRIDLLSLAAVSGVVLEMVREGAEAARERHDCLALGRLLEYLGRLDDAERCFAAAATDDGTLERELDRAVRADALHWLALHRRRAHRFREAAEAWRALSEISGVDAVLRREALEALAIHHEHRVKNLEAARAFALEALRLAGDARRAEAVNHRLGRLSHKLGGGPRRTVMDEPAGKV